MTAGTTDSSRNSLRIADEILSADEEEIVLPPSRPPSTAILLDIPPEISTPAPPDGVIGASLVDSQLLNTVETPPLAASDDLRDSIQYHRDDLLACDVRHSDYLTDFKNVSLP